MNNYIFKKSFIFLFSLLIILTMSSCNKNKQTYINNAMAIVYKDNTPYLINEKKETFNLSEYDEIIEIFNEYIAVKKEGKYGFIDLTGKLVIDTIYDKVYPMFEEKAVVIKDGNTYIINKDGNIIYTFDDKFSSESYFSNNHLVVFNKSNKYTYLTYHQNENTFTLCDDLFDYAGVFKDDYAVVGNFETEIIYKIDGEGNPTNEIDEIKYLENIKYNFYKSSNELLFPNFEFDTAEPFYNGFARVGKYATITVPAVDSNRPTKSFEGINYQFINEEGKYLEFDYHYTYSSKGVEEQRHKTGVVIMPYATNFNNGFAAIAQYRYSPVTDTFLKEYMIIDTEGCLYYTYAIYYETNFLFGYDVNDKYQTTTPSSFWINELVSIGKALTFRSGNTLNGSTWNVKYFAYDLFNERDEIKDVTWKLFDYDKDAEGNDVKITPDWMINYNAEFLDGVSSTVIAESAAKSPYEMSEIKYSQYFSDTEPLNRIRLVRSNKYGLVKYTENIIPINGYKNTSELSCEFVLEPIYDKIIF